MELVFYLEKLTFVDMSNTVTAKDHLRLTLELCLIRCHGRMAEENDDVELAYHYLMRERSLLYSFDFILEGEEDIELHQMNADNTFDMINGTLMGKCFVLGEDGIEVDDDINPFYDEVRTLMETIDVLSVREFYDYLGGINERWKEANGYK